MKYIKHNIRSCSATTGGIETEKLYGIDGTAAVRESSPTRADNISLFDGSVRPGCVNMIRKGAGTVTKRPGFRIEQNDRLPDTVDSVHIYYTYNGDVFYYVSGNVIREINGINVYDYELPFDMSDCRSMQADKYMFFFGKNGLVIANAAFSYCAYWGDGGYGGQLEKMYLPTIYIANTPDGAGSAYEAVNLLNPQVAEQYQGDGTSVTFATHLEGSGYTAYLKNTGGKWVKTAIASYTDRSVTLAGAPPKPDVTGEDNVRIVYSYADFESGLDEICGCTCGAVFGVGGHTDRVFLSGNVGRPGKVHYSHMDEPTYFGDIDYICVGDCETDVYALSREGDSLAVISDGGVFTVKGTDAQSAAVLQDALFAVTDIYSTPEPACAELPRSFMNESVYITREGVCAIAASGILDERQADIRSDRINSHLLKEDMASLGMLVFGDLLVIYNRKDTVYLLDGSQYTSVGTRRRYEGYIWKDIPAKHMWVYGGRLYFTDGHLVFCFNSGETSEHFCDERESGVYSPIEAYWETPYLYPADFKDFKFFTKVGVLTDADCDSDGREMNIDIEIYARFDSDDWRRISPYSGRLSIYRYGNIDYGSFTYSDRVKNYATGVRLLHKKGRGLKLRFQNDKLRRPFTLLRFGAEYMKM